MKKTLAVLLVCVLVMASAFAFSFRSLGIETGGGYYVSGDMDIIDNLDIYVRLGYSGQFNLSFGGQYKVADFKIDSTKFDFKPGLQLGFGFGDFFNFTALATFQFIFEAGHFSAFVRPGLGLSVISWKTYNGRDSSADFAFVIETGVAYLF